MRSGRQPMLACALVITVLGGCAGTTTPQRGSEATAPAGQSALAPDLAAVQATLTRYFTALKAGDFTAAMNERCRATRIPAEQRDLFLSQTKELFKMGAITGVEVSEPSLRLLPVETSISDPVPFDYAIITGTTRSDSLHGVAITQDAAIRLCGYAQPHLKAMTDALAPPVVSGDDLSGTLEAMIPTKGPAGYEQFDDTALSKPNTPTPGWQAAWTRVWRLPTYGGVRVTATRFDTTASATAAVSASLARATTDATETFTVPGVRNAIGVRFAGVAWTLLQPPNVGYQNDRVLMLYRHTVITIEAAGLTPDQSHQVVMSLATNIGR